MSGQIAKTFLIHSAANIYNWPLKDYPNNAIASSVGLVSLLALSNVFKVSYFYSCLLAGTTTFLVNTYQNNQKEQKKQMIDSKTNTILQTMEKLDGFADDNIKFMKTMFILGKDQIESWFNLLNKDKSDKIHLLAELCDVPVTELATIWIKEPNFDDASATKRLNLFIEKVLKDDDLKQQFRNT